MKVIEWVIAVVLVVIGLSCLTMSATLLGGPNSIGPYLHILLQICFWAGVPVLITMLVYFLLIRGKR